MRQFKAEILENRRISADCYLLILNAPQVASEVHPGQFLHLRCGEELPLLRRPFSVHRVERASGKVGVLYRVVGRGTRILSTRGRGEEIDLLGPLGKGFRLPRNFSRVVVIGGGMGVAPLFFLVQRLEEKLSPSGIKVIIGAKEKEEVLFREELGKKADLLVSTEDGSIGYRGMATELLEKILWEEEDSPSLVIFGCGPRPMLRRLWEISKEFNLPAQASFEERMGCGVGACLGCVIKTKRGYERVCKEGPVFNLSDILWEEYPLE